MGILINFGEVPKASLPRRPLFVLMLLSTVNNIFWGENRYGFLNSTKKSYK